MTFGPRRMPTVLPPIGAKINKAIFSQCALFLSRCDMQGLNSFRDGRRESRGATGRFCRRDCSLFCDVMRANPALIAEQIETPNLPDLYFHLLWEQS